MIRAFIAIDIPDDVRAAIEEAQAQLKRAHIGVKISWTKIDNLHLTLQFLGYIEEALVDKIKSKLQSMAGEHRPFDLSVHGAGAFPNENRARVIWVGCGDNVVGAGSHACPASSASDHGGSPLRQLARSVQAAMQPLGFEPEHREFSAHLTLGRIKMPRSDVALTRAVESLKNTVFGTLRVEAIHLFESQLHPEGSIYSKLSTHRLASRS
jgi:RNA 2',3'-cyclic 3'-phosphodiesterase